MQFGKFETREQVQRRLETPVRELFSTTKMLDPVLAHHWTDIRDILAELDRLNLVIVAQRTVRNEKALREIAARQGVNDSLLPGDGQCSEQISTEVWARPTSQCKHPAKSRLPGCSALCGVHLRRPLESAIRQAQTTAEKEHASEEPSEAEKIVFADLDLRRTRETWVK